MEHLSDKSLIIAKDEQAAFTILYNRYWEQLYIKALNRLGNDADAQDCVQEVFISCWRNRQTIQVSESIAPYLFGALKYGIIKKAYKNAQAGRLVPLSAESLQQTDVTADELLHYKELQQIIAGEVAKLPTRMREIYRLSRMEYLPIAAIATQLQVSEQTVKNTLSSALKRLRQELSIYSNGFLLLL